MKIDIYNIYKRNIKKEDTGCAYVPAHGDGSITSSSTRQLPAGRVQLSTILYWGRRKMLSASFSNHRRSKLDKEAILRDVYTPPTTPRTQSRGTKPSLSLLLCTGPLRPWCFSLWARILHFLIHIPIHTFSLVDGSVQP